MAQFLDMLDKRVRDYVLETGEESPLDSLASIMCRAVDPDTADRMDESRSSSRTSVPSKAP